MQLSSSVYKYSLVRIIYLQTLFCLVFVENGSKSKALLQRRGTAASDRERPTRAEQPHPPLPLGTGIEWGSPRDDIIKNQIGYGGDIKLSVPLISRKCRWLFATRYRWLQRVESARSSCVLEISPSCRSKRKPMFWSFLRFQVCPSTK